MIFISSIGEKSIWMIDFSDEKRISLILQFKNQFYKHKNNSGTRKRIYSVTSRAAPLSFLPKVLQSFFCSCSEHVCIKLKRCEPFRRAPRLSLLLHLKQLIMYQMAKDLSPFILVIKKMEKLVLAVSVSILSLVRN